MLKPSLPQGTRDFTAATVHKRNYILGTIRAVLELHGFEPLETPALENLETLTGKYGVEGDKLIFKVLNNGLSDPKNFDRANEGFQKMLAGKSSAALTERALKYDLTIPFARHVAMNAGVINFPYKRYQIQNVWRADRPQRGRYREFTQCDADVVGSTSLLNELELCNIYHRALTRLGLQGYRLKINSRKLLQALAEATGGVEKMIDITISIDKLDKIGPEKVKEELSRRGLSANDIDVIEKYLGIAGSNEEKIAAVKHLFGENEAAKKGIEELQYLADHAGSVNLDIDLTLARGLNYYTGIIFEVKAPETVNIGSIGGGGRYDDLTGLFGLAGISGVGISFGIDRIYDVMEELELFPHEIAAASKVFFLNMGTAEADTALALLNDLRDNGIAGELYPEQVKPERQLKYAGKKNIPFAVIIGTEEMNGQFCSVKNLQDRTQEKIFFNELIHYFKNK